MKILSFPFKHAIFIMHTISETHFISLYTHTHTHTHTHAHTHTHSFSLVQPLFFFLLFYSLSLYLASVSFTSLSSLSPLSIILSSLSVSSLSPLSSLSLALSLSFDYSSADLENWHLSKVKNLCNFLYSLVKVLICVTKYSLKYWCFLNL